MGSKTRTASSQDYGPTIERRLRVNLAFATNGCIEWTGSVNAAGYGRLSRGPRGAGVAFAHRVAWSLVNGPIPDGMFICHRCDNPPCCNPDHLFIGTPADNMLDKTAKGRGRGQLPPGEAHPSARLTDAQVAQLRDDYATVGNYAELGRRYGVTKQHARALVLGIKRPS